MIQVNYPLPYTLETSLPLVGYDGQLVLNTADSTLYFWLNGQWNAITGGGATVDGVYLSELGDYFITEAGDYLATE